MCCIFGAKQMACNYKYVCVYIYTRTWVKGVELFDNIVNCIVNL